MKYSLKNKEFSRKKHNIFDNNPRKSRSKSASGTPKKSLENSNDNIQNQYSINIKPLSLDYSAIDNLNSFDSHKNSLHANQQEKSQFHFFSRVQNAAEINKKPLMTTNSNAIRPSQPVKFILPPKTNSQLRNNKVTEKNKPRIQSFQVKENQNNSRVNKFFAESILAKESQSPHSKVVFEPVIRKSLSPQPSSLSPEPRFGQQLNKVTQINLRIQPEEKVINYNFQSEPVKDKKITIVQIPRQIVRVQSQKIPQLSIPSNGFQENQKSFQTANDLVHTQEIVALRKKVQEQNLQIQYLKNQKEILQSDIQLQFSPKKTPYQPQILSQNSNLRKVTPQKYGVPFARNIDQQIDRNKLIELAQILKHNQAKIMSLQIKCHSFYTQLYQNFNQSLYKCQDHLIKIFSEKYFNFAQEINAKLFLIDQKSAQIMNLDHKIDVFTNTFRSIEQSLRITKLKQQNIQLLIQNKKKKSERYWNKQEPSRTLLMQNQSDISSIRIFNDNQMEEKDREDLKRLEKNIKQKRCSALQLENNKQDLNQFDSFLDEKYSHLVYNPQKENYISNQRQRFVVSQIYDEAQKKNYTNKSTTEQIQQFSPFQANQMFKKHINTHHNNQNYSKYFHTNQRKHFDIASSNSKRQSFNQQKGQTNRVNLSLDDTSSKNYDFSDNSFEVDVEFKETPRNHFQKQISFTSKNMFKKQPNKINSQNEDISDTLQGEQERLINILKNKNYQFPVECWIDELGCLRKKNQTYIFDEQGSVIMTTSAAFKKLKQKKLFT